MVVVVLFLLRSSFSRRGMVSFSKKISEAVGLVCAMRPMAMAAEH